MFDKEEYDLRSEIIKEIDESLLMEVYEKECLSDICPKFTDKDDPDRILRLSAGAWTLSLILENCCVKEEKDGTDWFVQSYGERGGEIRKYKDGVWQLKKGRKPNWIDYRIPFSGDRDTFSIHALIDLHLGLIRKARSLDNYDPDDVQALDDWADRQANEGSN